MFLNTSLVSSSSYRSAVFIPPSQLYTAHNNQIHSYTINPFTLINTYPFNLPILKIHSIPNTNYIIILFNDLSLSIYSFIQTPIQLIYTTQLVNYKTPQYQHIFIDATPTYVLIHYSTYNFVIIPYLEQTFQLPIHVPINEPFPIQVLPLPTPSHPTQFNIVLLKYLQNNNTASLIQINVNLDEQPQQIQQLNQLNFKPIQAYTFDKFICYYSDSSIIINQYGSDSFNIFPLEPKPILNKPPRTILQIDNNTLLFQSYQNIYKIFNNKCIYLGNCSEGEDLVYVSNNRIFVASIYENSQLISVENDRIEVLANLKNIGPINDIFVQNDRMYAATPISNVSLHGISTQIKLSRILDNQIHDKPKYFHTFRNNYLLKMVQINNQLFGFNKQNELISMLNDDIVKKVKLNFNPSDIGIINDDLIISQWFGSVIHIYSQDKLQQKYEIKLNQDYQIGDTMSEMSIKSVFYCEKLIFCSFSDGSIVIIDGNKVHIQRLDNAIVRFIDQEEFLIGLCANKLIIYYKENLRKKEKEYYIVNQENVHDVQIYKDKDGQYIIEVCRKNEEIRSELEIKIMKCQIAELKEHNQVEMVRSSGNVQYLVKNQAFWGNNVIWNDLGVFANSEYASQCQVTVTFSENIQWNEHILHSHKFQGKQGRCVEILKMKEFSILAIGGKYFDEKKKGFLNILIFDENSTPVDGNEYKLADEVKDIKFMEDGLSLYMITELKLVLVQFSSSLGSICSKLKVLQVIVDTHIVPEQIQIQGRELMMYDYIQSMSIYDIQTNKPSRKIYQTFTGITYQIKYLNNYIIRTSSELTIYIYQQKLTKKLNKGYLQKIGFINNNENITCVFIKNSQVFLGSKQGNIRLFLLLNDKEQVLLNELQSEIKRFKEQNITKELKMEKKSQSQKEKEKYAQKYLQKLFAQREEKLENVGIEDRILVEFERLSKEDQEMIQQNMKSVKNLKELNRILQSLMDQLII